MGQLMSLGEDLYIAMTPVNAELGGGPRISTLLKKKRAPFWHANRIYPLRVRETSLWLPVAIGLDT